MLKKVLTLTTLSVLAVNLAQADHGFYKSGFQLGAHVGGSFGKGRFDSYYEDGSVLTPLRPSIASTQNSSFLFGISGGYTYKFHNSFTLGASLAFNWLANQKMAVNSKFTVYEGFRNTLKRKYSAMPSINLGKVFAQRYHAYLGLGASISRFEMDVYNYGDTKQSEVYRKTKVAFMPSVGLDYALTQHVLLTAKASYEMFPNISNRFGKAYLLPNAGNSAYYDTKIQPRFITLNVGVAYKF